jgi:hypothetical protein
MAGDFTKSVILKRIFEHMEKTLKSSKLWQVHFKNLPVQYDEKVPGLHADLQGDLAHLSSTTFRRERLQTRFFELGNSYYLGMEFPREYDLWKQKCCAKVAPPRPATVTDAARKLRLSYSKAITHNIDRLWYEATLEIIREGDVYSPISGAKIPDLTPLILRLQWSWATSKNWMHSGFSLNAIGWRMGNQRGFARSKASSIKVPFLSLRRLMFK